MEPLTTKDKEFEELKKKNQEDIKKIYAVPVRIIKDFEKDYIYLTNHPILKKSWKSEVEYEGRDYEGGNED